MTDDPAFPGAVPLAGWTEGNADWLTARRRGLGASEVASALGLPGAYATPWQVWASKTGRMVDVELDSQQVTLGTDLESWLVDAADRRFREAVLRPEYRLYGNRARPWVMASPDAVRHTNPYMRLVECKTAGIVEPNTAKDWTLEEVPLRVEVQARWQLATVEVRTGVDIVGLVAGIGLHFWTVEWSYSQEQALLRAASEWWGTHVINDVEPAMMPADDAVMNGLHSMVEGSVELPPGAGIVLAAYRSAVAEGAAADRRRKQCAATLKHWLAGATQGTLEGRSVVSWEPNKNGVRSIRVKGE